MRSRHQMTADAEARDWESLRRWAIGALVLAVGLGTVSSLLFALAFQFRVDWFLDPAQVVAGGAASAQLLKWGAITDLFSYYLPTAVVALALRVALRPRGPAIADMATLGALGYVLAGSIGAMSLASGGSMLIEAYAQPGADQAAIAALFRTLTEIVFLGIWQFLDAVFIAAWMLGIGVLIRADQPAFGRFSLMLGALFVVGALLNALGLGLGPRAGLGVLVATGFAFVVLAVWMIWLALLLWRREPPFAGPPFGSSGQLSRAR